MWPAIKWGNQLRLILRVGMVLAMTRFLLVGLTARSARHVLCPRGALGRDRQTNPTVPSDGPAKGADYVVSAPLRWPHQMVLRPSVAVSPLGYRLLPRPRLVLLHKGNTGTTQIPEGVESHRD